MPGNAASESPTACGISAAPSSWARAGAADVAVASAAVIDSRRTL
jgi:hypothetical protein